MSHLTLADSMTFEKYSDWSLIESKTDANQIDHCSRVKIN